MLHARFTKWPGKHCKESAKGCREPQAAYRISTFRLSDASTPSGFSRRTYCHSLSVSMMALFFASCVWDMSAHSLTVDHIPALSQVQVCTGFELVFHFYVLQNFEHTYFSSAANERWLVVSVEVPDMVSCDGFRHFLSFFAALEHLGGQGLAFL